MKWFASASKIQVQSGLMVSWNECLNMWSRRKFKFTRSRVRHFIPLRLWYWKILFGAGLMNLRMLEQAYSTQLYGWLKEVIFKGIFLIFIKGALSGLRQFLGNWKPFKNDEKCILFHLKSSFCSQDI